MQVLHALVVIGQRWLQGKCRNSNPSTHHHRHLLRLRLRTKHFFRRLHSPTPLLHPAPWASLVHGSQILSDVAQGESPFTAFVSTDDEQDVKHGVVRETINLVPGCAWQEESPANEGAGTGVGCCPRWADAAEASGWRILGCVIWVQVLVFFNFG